MTLRHT